MTGLRLPAFTGRWGFAIVRGRPGGGGDAHPIRSVAAPDPIHGSEV